MKAALYARVSTKDHGQDTENQLVELRSYCAKENWEIVGEYIDHASGKSGSRTEFQRLFDDAAKRKFDLVMFWALDRFSREGTLPTLRYLDELDSYKVGFRSYTERWLDTTGIFKDVLLALLATLAQQERVRLGERIRAGLNLSRKRGTKSGRRKSKINMETLVANRQKGSSMRDLAESLGVSVMTIKRRLDGMENKIVCPKRSRKKTKVKSEQ